MNVVSIETLLCESALSSRKFTYISPLFPYSQINKQDFTNNQAFINLKS